MPACTEPSGRLGGSQSGDGRNLKRTHLFETGAIIPLALWRRRPRNHSGPRFGTLEKLAAVKNSLQEHGYATCSGSTLNCSSSLYLGFSAVPRPLTSHNVTSARLPMASLLPSGENRILSADVPLSRGKSPTSSPVPETQILEREPAAAKCLPLGENATPLTKSFNWIACSSRPLATSQTWMRPP